MNSSARSCAKNRRLAVFFASSGLLLIGLFAWADTVNFPTMTVVGTRGSDGEALLCVSGACFDSANQEALQSFLEWQQMYDSIPPDDLPLDGGRFCSNLEARKPSGCSLGNPPASPGITISGRPDYQPNGCGTGGIGNLIQDFALEVFSSNYYSGNIDEPYPNVSFLAACNAHDTCWAAGGARHLCDGAFMTGMHSACGGIAGPGQNTCLGFAGLYHGAVSATNPSDSAYQTSTGRRACAVWALEMRENECDE